ncbi:MAG: glycoside hydrolase family 3 C-terminal domain-containing protein, partial [Clostridia bacterium]|nr:glycoside hydrolase family 3 C-terminal domain-containing protein [Clostridia bacterium]
QSFVESVADEGITLLKNNGVLPLAKNAKVTPFGYRYVSPVWGGAGSAATNMNFDYVETPAEALNANFTVNATVENKLKAATALELKSSDAAFKSSGSTDMTIYEFDSSVYVGTESSCTDTVGVVFIGRLGQEGDDMWSKPYDNGAAQHSLQLTTPEKNAIAFAKANCASVVVVCNFSNIVEIGELKNDADIDAILWVGNPGAMGMKALGEIMVGDVNPSGRTVDTWIADYTADPTWANTLDGTYTNIGKDINGVNSNKFFEYEEGIYMGYRYYETAAAEKAAGNYAGFDYDAQVVYPFGYGLSYTDFSWSIKDISLASGSALAADSEITLTVSVKNEGDRAGKDVVELYSTPPYIKGGIEKAHVNLIDFAKTELIPAGETRDVT